MIYFYQVSGTFTLNFSAMALLLDTWLRNVGASVVYRSEPAHGFCPQENHKQISRNGKIKIKGGSRRDEVKECDHG